MALICTVPPTVEPVALSDLKDFLRIDAGDTSNDAVLSGLALAARQWCETYTWRRFCTQTWQLSMDFFPGTLDQRFIGASFSSPFVSGANSLLVGIRYAMILPFPPVQSVASFTYQDQNGNTVAMTGGVDYDADLLSQPARLTPLFGKFWPVAQVIPNAVQVSYVCGYGDATAVPEGIKTAIKLLTAYWYENRVPDESNIPMAVKAVLGPYKDFRV